MVTPFVYCLIFLVLVFLTSILFASEIRRGVRFGDSVRSRIDYGLLRIEHYYNVRFREWGRSALRQTIQYCFHTTLKICIQWLRVLESSLITLLRSNRAIARKTDHERTTQNKLDAMVIHKIETALTAKGKRD